MVTPKMSILASHTFTTTHRLVPCGSSRAMCVLCVHQHLQVASSSQKSLHSQRCKTLNILQLSAHAPCKTGKKILFKVSAAIKSAPFVKPAPCPGTSMSCMNEVLTWAHACGMSKVRYAGRAEQRSQLPGIKHQPSPRRSLSAPHAMLNHPTGPTLTFPESFTTQDSQAAWLSHKCKHAVNSPTAACRGEKRAKSHLPAILKVHILGWPGWGLSKTHDLAWPGHTLP